MFWKRVFSDVWKVADVSPVLKQCESLNKENYTPVNILSHMSTKVFERILLKQINNSMTSNLSPLLCSFRKNRNSQYFLRKIMDIWNKYLDKGGRIGIIFMDLSKAFNTINRSLLLPKLEAYGFSTKSLKSMQNYLCNRFQRSIGKGIFSDWTQNLSWIPQGSFSGLILFTTFLI